MHLGRNGVDVRNRAIIWSGALCVVLASPVFGQTPHEVQSQTPDRSAFIELLERAVAANDRAYVAAQLQFAGSLVAGGRTRTYCCTEGQLVQVRVDRGGGEAVLDMVHATLGTRISPNAPKTAIAIAGRAPESGDYRISVRHVGQPDAPPLPYMLSGDSAVASSLLATGYWLPATD